MPAATMAAKKKTVTTTSSPVCDVEWGRGVHDVRLVLNVTPVPASRPRVSKWGAYYGKNHTAWKKLAEQHIPEAEHKLMGPIEAVIEVVCPRPKTTKRDWPRGDVDNFVKLFLDILTDKGYWLDDDEITVLHVAKRFVDEDEPARMRIHASNIL